MAKLVYTACKCINRGDCYMPGTVGNLYLVTKGKLYPIRPCLRCK